MAIVTGIREKHDIPHESGEWFEFRMLSGKQLETAEQMARMAAINQAKALGGELFDVITKAAPTNDSQPAAAPETDYDTDFLLQHAIIGWSYAEPVNVTNVDALDPVTRTWAKDVVLEMSRPRTEAERLDFLSASTSH